MYELKHTVKFFRDQGLEAKWSRTKAGQPCMFLRDPNGQAEHQRSHWWMLDRKMGDMMIEFGTVQGFHQATICGDFFSVSV